MKVNGFSSVLNSNINIVENNPQKKYATKNFNTNLNTEPKAFTGLTLVKIPAYRKLKAKAFSTATKENYKPAIEWGTPVQYKYIQKNAEYGEQKFHENLNPKTLKIETERKSGIDLDNLSHPNGSIGVASRLNDVISTSGMWQCAAISFVNKKENTQVLAHICPTIHKVDNESLIEYIMENMPQDGLEINIAPGIYSDTDNTISFLVETIKKFNKDAEIEFCNFPKGFERVILENGELKCIEENRFRETERNPMDKIFYASTR